MSLEENTDLRAVMDGLGQGLLIFSSDGRLILENLAARTILGTDINVLKAEGWQAASVLFNTRQTTPDESLDTVRAKALQSSRPVRFRTFRSGQYLPCWMSSINMESGEVHTLIVLDAPDWTFLTSLLDRFRTEFVDAIDSTRGHIDLITAAAAKHADESGEQIVKRISGFTRLISIHMDRVGRLMTMLQRLETVRTGQIRDNVRDRRKKLRLDDFLEDMQEGLAEIALVDPETDAGDVRARLKVTMPDKLAVSASPAHLTQILHDILRNAIMYSMKATPIKIKASQNGQFVQIDVVDEGYGIREKERERVFEPFQRARQPQIISEFGYGLSLYLCKNEIEAMNGRIWFESEEGVGTTFSFMLPAWSTESSSSESKP